MDSEAQLSLVLKARNLASKEVDRLHTSLGRVGKAAGRLGGVLATLGKVGILGLVTAIGAAVGFLGMATKAAAEEQVGIIKLNTALKANVKGFNGNTDAIEKVIAKRELLAFSDDDLRNSLSTLVAKYGSVKKAQDIQAVAMDVARLKGISLADASLLVSKGMDGNAKVLKQLGIELPKTATAQDRLTAIQKKAAGQAEAYGKSAVGAQEAFGIAIGDVVEDIGTGLVPVMTQAFTWLKDVGIPAVRGIIGAFSKWYEQNRPLIDQIRGVMLKVLGMVIEKIGMVVGWIGRVVTAITSNKDAMNVLRAIFSAIATAVGLAVDAIGAIIGIIAKVVSAITSNKSVIKGFGIVWDTVGAAIGVVRGALSWILDNIGKVISALSSIKLPDITGITNLIPHFAAGGTVPGAQGQATLVVAHGGERVTAPNRGASRGDAGQATPIIVQLDGRELFRIMDAHGYRALQRAAPTIIRT